MLRLLLLDNYDSFTWNLAHYLEELGASVEVRLNDEVECDGVGRGGYDAVVLSPGPGRPEQAGISLDLVRSLAGRIPLLGEAFGARVVPAPTLVHGKTSPVLHDGTGVFRGLESPFDATRYHSLVVERDSLSRAFVVNAWTADGVVMGIRHRDLPLLGVQFHPESVLTLVGKPMLANFLRAVTRRRRERSDAA